MGITAFTNQGIEDAEIESQSDLVPLISKSTAKIFLTKNTILMATMAVMTPSTVIRARSAFR
jgi:hypothetical protein